MGTVYRVTFTDITKRNADYASNYDSLYNALDVVKNTEISNSRISRKVLTDEDFNEGLFQLLTQGYIHAGFKTEQYPNGSMVIYLTKIVNNEGLTTPVYAEQYSVPRQANGPFIVEYMTASGAEKTLTFHEKHKAILFVEGCGVENTYMVTGFNFTYEKEEVSK